MKSATVNCPNVENMSQYQSEDENYTVRKHLVALLATTDDEHEYQQEGNCVLMSIPCDKPVNWADVRDVTAGDPDKQNSLTTRSPAVLDG